MTDEPDIEELVDAVRAGDRGMHRLEGAVDREQAALIRRQVLEAETDADLSAVADHSFTPEETDGNVENLIGAAHIPMGVVGPVPINGEQAAGSHYLPLATTEGALLASVNRGCAVIREAGAATTRLHGSGMTRAPVFAVEDVAAATALVEWVRDNHAALGTAAEETTDHGELLGIDPYIVGNSVFLRFRYDTKDAMGMNMVTIATRAACEVIEAETDASLVSLSGNMCTDKKPAGINAIEGRGRSVTADVEIPRATVADRLHTTPEAIERVNVRKNLIGSAKAAALGFNAQAANVVAAAFLATGQDAAQIVEGSNVITSVEARPDSLYIAVSLASLEVGTVGGGTGLPTQAAALEVLGVHGGGDPPGANADALAEIIATGALAGELSLLGALSSRHLSSAHESLGR